MILSTNKQKESFINEQSYFLFFKEEVKKKQQTTTKKIFFFFFCIIQRIKQKTNCEYIYTCSFFSRNNNKKK